MTVWAKGMACRVVEHDEQTREPKPGGIVYPARVAEVTSMYVFIAYDDPEVYKRGRCDQFYADSGWRAWDGQLRWRLLPGTGDSGHAGLLTESQRFQVQEARDCLGTWDLARRADVIDRERVLADQVRNLLAIIDAVAPASG